MIRTLPRNRYVDSTNTGGTRLAVLFTGFARLVRGLPIGEFELTAPKNAMSPQELYFNLLISILLVLTGGVFAGLTLALMGQDEVYLKVMATSGEPHEQKHARKVLGLIDRGKHWVLVTLLLSNVITNESLPIVLDKCLGGGWPAVVASTAAIVIFGEIIPQSICVRYGLQVGATFAPFVLVLMYVMYPVAYPCAVLLDYILGEDHGTVYKKSGLKTLVTLHKTMGVERLNEDEVTIISAVLDLKEKEVAQIMTPIDRVYTMSYDQILDEETVEQIFNAGFNRIPIHLPNEPTNFIGMLLVRVLISYDPEDALPVAHFPLATLPETGADTSCLNILNYFQQGKSHMLVVSETPGKPTGALGVLTLEDVIEELIGEEIVDESDVYIDINKNIKRQNPRPLFKRNLSAYLHNLYSSANGSKRNSVNGLPRDLTLITPYNIINANALAKSSGRVKLGATGGVISSMFAPAKLAANPLETSKPSVTIKRHNHFAKGGVTSPSRTDPIDRELTPDQPKSCEGYQNIYTSEQDVLDEAKFRLDHDNCKANSSSKPNGHVSEQERLNGSENNDGSNVLDTDAAKLASTETNDSSSIGSGLLQLPVIMYLGLRSHRTSGIVESVVNVSGVHKTIIEDLSEDPSDMESPRQRRGSSVVSANEQTMPLIF